MKKQTKTALKMKKKARSYRHKLGNSFETRYWRTRIHPVANKLPIHPIKDHAISDAFNSSIDNRILVVLSDPMMQNAYESAPARRLPFLIDDPRSVGIQHSDVSWDSLSCCPHNCDTAECRIATGIRRSGLISALSYGNLFWVGIDRTRYLVTSASARNPVVRCSKAWFKGVSSYANLRPEAYQLKISSTSQSQVLDNNSIVNFSYSSFTNSINNSHSI